MIEKKLILADLHERILETTDTNTRKALEQILSEIISGKYNIRVWE